MDLAAHRPTHPSAAPAGRFVRAAQLVRRTIARIQFATPVLDLGIRIFVASVFLQAGLTKIMSWSTTLALFETEYSVPVLPPVAAAYLGSAAELGLPVLLLFGLGTRFAAIALFVFNIVAALSYPDLSEVGLQHHQYWGLLIMVTIFHGPGKLSLDHFISRRFASRD